MWVMTRPSSFARAVLLAGVAGVVLAACGRPPLSGASASPPAVVPWLPRPAAHLDPQPAPPSPASPIPVPAGTPSCGADQLEAMAIVAGAATGHVDTPVFLRDRGASACFLEGYADVAIVDASGGLLAQAVGAANRGTFFADGPVVPVLMRTGTAPLAPEEAASWNRDPGQAFMNLEWYDCRNRRSARVVVDLPAGADGSRLRSRSPGSRRSATHPGTEPMPPSCAGRSARRASPGRPRPP